MITRVSLWKLVYFMEAFVFRSGFVCVSCFCSLKLFKWLEFSRQRSYDSYVETAAARTFQKKSYLGVLLTCRPSDIILRNSFQNVTAGLALKKTNQEQLLIKFSARY